MTSSTTPQKDDASKVLPTTPVVGPEANKKDEANKTSSTSNDKK